MIGSRHFKFHDIELVDKLVDELLDFLIILRNLEISNEGMDQLLDAILDSWKQYLI
jgi:hypothetical protein